MSPPNKRDGKINATKSKHVQYWKISIYTSWNISTKTWQDLFCSRSQTKYAQLMCPRPACPPPPPTLWFSRQVWEARKAWWRGTVRCSVQDEHLLSGFCPKWQKFQVKTLKDTTGKTEETTSARPSLISGVGHRYCIWTPHMLEPVLKATVIKWLHGGMKLLLRR